METDSSASCAFCLQAAADYSAAYAGYGHQSPYASPYAYYPYMTSMGASSLGGSSASMTVPSTQTYQLLPPSTSGTLSRVDLMCAPIT